jgi:hypothetical protein
MAKKVLLLGANAPITVALPGQPIHYILFMLGEFVRFSELEEVKSAIMKADVIYSFLTEEEAEILGRELHMEIPSQNITRLVEAFLGGYTISPLTGEAHRVLDEPDAVFLVTPRWESHVEIYRVKLAYTIEG